MPDTCSRGHPRTAENTRGHRCRVCDQERHHGKPAPVVVLRPIIPVQSIYVPTERLIGRAVMALMLGPLPAGELAARCGVSLDELAERAHVLRPWVEAIRLEATDLAYGRWESCARVEDARAEWRRAA